MRGSHRQFKHALFPETLTVAGKPSAEMPPDTLSAILKQARLKR
jgi:predicted RNA binding protein YcfA (HicA-like mRNA interferase family)